jgi:hypothetical protein
MAAYGAGLTPEGWLALTEDLLQFPGWMMPAVRLAVKKGFWRRANDPVKCVRENAQREAGRSGLSAGPAGTPGDSARPAGRAAPGGERENAMTGHTRENRRGAGAVNQAIGTLWRY